jgi:aryl-alcohol dehydrogenase-like predicted oxidoreductase
MYGRPTAAAAGKIDVGGDLTVNRLGFGAMRITGPGIWGDPPDRDRAKEALRRAVALDVNFIDTADSYGPEASERLIAEALYPYPEELVIATKGGLVRPGPGQWVPDGRPEHLRGACEGSLRRLRLDRMPIPGSGDPEHVEQNIAAASIELTAKEIRAITLAVLSRWSRPRRSTASSGSRPTACRWCRSTRHPRRSVPRRSAPAGPGR